MFSLLRVLPTVRLPTTSLLYKQQLTLINTFASKPQKKVQAVKGKGKGKKEAPKKIEKTQKPSNNTEKLRKEKEKEKERLQKEKEKERLQKEKEKEKERLQKEKEKERLQKEKEKEKERLQKEKEKEKEKLQKGKEKEKEKLAKEKDKKEKEKEKEREKLEKVRAEKEQKKKEKAEKPKRPITAFFHYGIEARAAILKKDPSLKVTEVMKQIATQWGKLSADQKKKYEAQNQKGKEEYQKAVAKYKQTHPDPPKRPATAFFLFAQEARPALVKKNPNLKVSEVAKQLGVQWGKLTDDQKKVYQEKSTKNKAQYEKEKGSFEKLKAKIAGASASA